MDQIFPCSGAAKHRATYKARLAKGHISDASICQEQEQVIIG